MNNNIDDEIKALVFELKEKFNRNNEYTPLIQSIEKNMSKLSDTTKIAFLIFLNNRAAHIFRNEAKRKIKRRCESFSPDTIQKMIDQAINNNILNPNLRNRHLSSDDYKDLLYLLFLEFPNIQKNANTPELAWLCDRLKAFNRNPNLRLASTDDSILTYATSAREAFAKKGLYVEELILQDDCSRFLCGTNIDEKNRIVLWMNIPNLSQFAVHILNPHKLITKDGKTDKLINFLEPYNKDCKKGSNNTVLSVFYTPEDFESIQSTKQCWYDIINFYGLDREMIEELNKYSAPSNIFDIIQNSVINSNDQNKTLNEIRKFLHSFKLLFTESKIDTILAEKFTDVLTTNFDDEEKNISLLKTVIEILPDDDLNKFLKNEFSDITDIKKIANIPDLELKILLSRRYMQQFDEYTDETSIFGNNLTDINKILYTAYTGDSPPVSYRIPQPASIDSLKKLVILSDKLEVPYFAIESELSKRFPDINFLDTSLDEIFEITHLPEYEKRVKRIEYNLSFLYSRLDNSEKKNFSDIDYIQELVESLPEFEETEMFSDIEKKTELIQKKDKNNLIIQLMSEYLGIDEIKKIEEEKQRQQKEYEMKRKKEEEFILARIKDSSINNSMLQQISFSSGSIIDNNLSSRSLNTLKRIAFVKFIILRSKFDDDKKENILNTLKKVGMEKYNFSQECLDSLNIEFNEQQVNVTQQFLTIFKQFYDEAGDKKDEARAIAQTHLQQLQQQQQEGGKI